MSPSACKREFNATTKINMTDPEYIISVYSSPKEITFLLDPIKEKTFSESTKAYGKSLEKIANEANNTSFGLAASVWTKDISVAHKLAAKIRAGTVWINCHNIFDASLPFGGYKESGWGREMGHEVLKNYTEVKAVTVNL